MRTNERSSYPWRTCLGIFIAVLLLMGLCSRVAEGQGAVYGLFQPADLGIGVRADYSPGPVTGQLWRNCGVYSSLTYGSWGAYKAFGLEHHIKFTVGGFIPLRSDHSYQCFLTYGVNYHHLGGIGGRDPQVDTQLYKNLSHEWGITVKWYKLAICVATDVPRWEPCIGIGFIF